MPAADQRARANVIADPAPPTPAVLVAQKVTKGLDRVWTGTRGQAFSSLFIYSVVDVYFPRIFVALDICKSFLFVVHSIEILVLLPFSLFGCGST